MNPHADMGSVPVAELSPPRPRPPRFTYSSGDRPLDGYTIKRGIGCGGFGEVYYAISDGGKEVALKLVQRHLDVELRGVSQCLNLKHANLVVLYDVKETDAGERWVVMEYMGGENLADLIERHPNGLAPEQALQLLRGIVAGVAYLHDHGIVHRDLKPGNIFIEDGQVKIGDYGLAKFISSSRRSGQTESVGTVHYMAPELSKGCYGKEIDHYAVGVILYEMLTGRVPFEGKSPGEILMKHLTSRPDLSCLPPAYQPVVGRMLEKEPTVRYASLSEAIHELSGGAPSSSRPATMAAAVPALPLASPQGPASSGPRRLLRPPQDRVFAGVCSGIGLYMGIEPVIVRLIYIAIAIFTAVVPAAFIYVLLALIIPNPTAPIQLVASAPRPSRRSGGVFVRLILSLLIGAGVGVLCGSLWHATFRSSEEVAVIGSIGMAAFFSGTLFFLLCRPMRGRAAIWPGLSSLMMGAGVGLTTASYAHFLGGPWDDEVSALLGVGAGLLTGGLSLFVLYTSLGVAMRWRWFFCWAFLSVGTGLATGGLGTALVGSQELVALVAVGAGFMTAGLLASLLIFGPLPEWVAPHTVGAGNVPLNAMHPSQLHRTQTWYGVVPGSLLKSWPVVLGSVMLLAIAGATTIAALAVFSCQQSGPGREVAATYNPALLTVQWETERFTGHRGPVNTVAFSHNGVWLATGDSTGSVRLWDVNGGGKPRTFTGHNSAIHSVVFSPDDRRVAAAGNCRDVRIWDVESGDDVAKSMEHPGAVHSIAFNDDGSRLVTGSSDDVVRVFDAETGDEITRYFGCKSDVRGVAFSPNGKRVAAVSRIDGIVHIWDAATRQHLHALGRYSYNPGLLAFTPDGKEIALAGTSGEVSFWNVETGELTRRFEGRQNVCNSMAIAPHGQLVACGGVGDIRVWDLNLRTIVCRFTREPYQYNQFNSVRFSPDGSYLATGGDDGNVRLWEVPAALRLNPQVVRVERESFGERELESQRDTADLPELPEEWLTIVPL